MSLKRKQDQFVELHNNKKVKVIFNEERRDSSTTTLSDLESKFESNSDSSDNEEDEIEETHQAVVVNSFKEPFTIVHNSPKHELTEYEVLIENKYIGLNPVDWKGHKYQFGIYSFPWIQGRESSGIISKLGSKVENFKKGDEVFFVSTSYRDLRTSTFQKYSVFDSRLIWKKPEGLKMSECGGIGVGLVTAASVLEETGCGFFASATAEKETKQDNKENIENKESTESVKSIEDKVEEEEKTLLIWGGSTGVGSYIIQLSKLAGFKNIIVIASLKHKQHLESLGATHIIDRFLSKEDIIAELKKLDKNISVGVDVVGKETSNNVIEFLNLSKPSKENKKTFIGVVAKPSLSEEHLANIDIKQVLIKKFHEDLDFGKSLIGKTQHLLNESKIKPQKNLKLYSGFQGIIDGLTDLEKFGASNEKYIVEL